MLRCCLRFAQLLRPVPISTFFNICILQLRKAGSRSRQYDDMSRTTQPFPTAMMPTRQARSLMLLLIIITQLVGLIHCHDPAGYILPSWGVASTTQFQIGPEFGSGTSCGASAWPKGINAGNPATGAGPGFLYAAINQLAFGANPSGEIVGIDIKGWHS